MEIDPDPRRSLGLETPTSARHVISRETVTGLFEPAFCCNSSSDIETEQRGKESTLVNSVLPKGGLRFSHFQGVSIGVNYRNTCVPLLVDVA